MSFLDVEREYIRRKIVPDFEWLSFESPTQAAPLGKPVRECRVALVTTSGAYVASSQEPFDTKSRLGDDSFRVIPDDVPLSDCGLSHSGYDTRRALHDLDCVFPLGLLHDLCDDGTIGESSPRHFSFMGYVPRPERLVSEHAPRIASLMREDGVDLAVLVPS
jgi:D-proline reductase (dithiol) PrdB